MRKRRIKQGMALAGLMLLSAGMGRARADYCYGVPVKVPNVNVSPGTIGGSISADGLELYLAVENSGYGGMFDMYVAKRASKQKDWGPPVNLGPTLNGTTWEHAPNISPDGLALHFSSDRPGGSGGLDLWVSTRATTSDPWGKPSNLGPTVNSSARDLCARESADGLTLLFHSQRSGGIGGEDIWIATRATKNDLWGPTENLGAPVNSAANDGQAVMTADGLTLFFNSDRAGGSGNYDLWVTTRRATSDPWGPPSNLGPTVNSPAIEWCSSLAADGSTLYFTSDRPTVWGPCSIYQTSILPIVDLNGDGKVDAFDVSTLLDNWGRNEPLCDIGPTPFGDGIVDMQDLAALTRYASQKLVDPTLLACWAFDEADQIAACHSAGTYPTLLVGNPVWSPDGAVGGALELDGVDDCVTTGLYGHVLEGPLSVLAWVKGGRPGQVIFSQQGAANWLCADAATGALMTELRGPARGARGLCSPAVITDGKWHRIGLVWNGPSRALYVDGVAVAEDGQDGFQCAGADLTIGSGKDLAAGSFWSGLIDDVRIYTRAVRP